MSIILMQLLDKCRGHVNLGPLCFWTRSKTPNKYSMEYSLHCIRLRRKFSFLNVTNVQRAPQVGQRYTDSTAVSLCWNCCRPQDHTCIPVSEPFSLVRALIDKFITSSITRWSRSTKLICAIIIVIIFFNDKLSNATHNSNENQVQI